MDVSCYINSRAWCIRVSSLTWYLWSPLQSPHDHALVSRLKLRLAGIRGDGKDGYFMGQVASAFHSSGDAATTVSSRCRSLRRRRGLGKVASPLLAKLAVSAKLACRGLMEPKKSPAQLEALLVQGTHRLPVAQGVMQWTRALAFKQRRRPGPLQCRSLFSA